MAIRIGTSTPSKLYLGVNEVTKAYFGASEVYSTGGGAWTPADLTGLALWLDAADSSTITLNGTDVSQWDDKSGNGNHAAQAVAANQPARVTNGIQFDGTDDYMDITAANIKTVTQPFVYAMVVDLNSGATFKPVTDGITNNLDRVITGNEGAGDNDGMWSGSPVNAATQVTATAVRVYNFASPSSSYFRNGISVASGDSGAQNPSNGIRLGADHDLSGANYSNILFNEYVVIDDALSPTDRQKLEGYLAHKWGLTANLPADHPYKLTPPYTGEPVYDPDAQAYITAVETADGQALEEGVRTAINDFVVGCKDDGIWDAIKSSAILAGARTLSGALQPLAGTAPTNFNFVSGDYDRKTGLKGDGSTKYLDSNRNANVDPQDDYHISVYVSADIGTSGQSYIGAADPFNEAGGTSIGGNGAGPSVFSRNRTSNVTFFGVPLQVGLLGSSRSSPSSYSVQYNGVNGVANETSSTPNNRNVVIFGRASTALTSSRLSFYSIGEALDLALLDARVATLMTAIDGAIA